MTYSLNEVNFYDKGLAELFSMELINLKINIFKNIREITKKKCFAEALFEINIFLYTYLDNQDYLNLLEAIFIKQLKYLKDADKASQTIISYIDSIKGHSEKGNKVSYF